MKVFLALTFLTFVVYFPFLQRYIFLYSLVGFICKHIQRKAEWRGEWIYTVLQRLRLRMLGGASGGGAGGGGDARKIAGGGGDV
ncbi:hypothetical protein DdX_00277 [Ditylenchus destructor]|uniref:Uncharacterized protein n=1 Tax=Ditylenchus destructor TaxID=166010 RepID=A0AAD4RCU2_9BILA|nr:hypothetical protein DdX_00277 [Ditylenchus destructor]